MFGKMYLLNKSVNDYYSTKETNTGYINGVKQSPFYNCLNDFFTILKYVYGLYVRFRQYSLHNKLFLKEFATFVHIRICYFVVVVFCVAFTCLSTTSPIPGAALSPDFVLFTLNLLNT